MRTHTLLFALLLGAGCNVLDGNDSDVKTFDLDFSDWQPLFADLSAPIDSTLYQIVVDWRDLPDEVASDGTSSEALFLQSMNRSDDVFMGAKRRLAGLEPGQTYLISFELALASNAGSGCAGAGGAPGEGVYVKAGASAIEPVAEVEDDDHYRLNVPKGNQSQGGEAALVLGNAATDSERCDDEVPYQMLHLTSAQASHAFMVDAAADGSLWVFVGTDSAYEGLTALYYDRVRIRLEAL